MPFHSQIEPCILEALCKGYDLGAPRKSTPGGRYGTDPDDVPLLRDRLRVVPRHGRRWPGRRCGRRGRQRSGQWSAVRERMERSFVHQSPGPLDDAACPRRRSTPSCPLGLGLNTVVARLKGIQARYGKDSIAFFASGKITNLERYMR